MTVLDSALAGVTRLGLDTAFQPGVVRRPPGGSGRPGAGRTRHRSPLHLPLQGGSVGDFAGQALRAGEPALRTPDRAVNKVQQVSESKKGEA